MHLRVGSHEFVHPGDLLTVQLLRDRFRGRTPRLPLPYSDFLCVMRAAYELLGGREYIESESGIKGSKIINGTCSTLFFI
jgi:hypothetical protein